jgi:ABC-type polysaccharide/polyol phosphate export permease
MLQPLMMMLVLYVVFSHVFRFDVYRYPVYVLAGILFWNFFQQSIVASMNSLRGNAGILQKLPVPKAVFPVASVLSGVVNLCLALVPLLAILIATGQSLEPALLFLPVSIILAAMFTLGAGLLLSPLAVFFSDVVELVGVVLMLLMYLTRSSTRCPSCPNGSGGWCGTTPSGPCSRCSATRSTTGRSRPFPM